MENIYQMVKQLQKRVDAIEKSLSPVPFGHFSHEWTAEQRARLSEAKKKWWAGKTIEQRRIITRKGYLASPMTKKRV